MTGTVSAETLLDLHQAGRLAVDYPSVARLIAPLTGDARLRAGRLLARLDPDEVLREHPGTPTLTAALTGHGTLAMLVPALTAELARHGILLRPHLTDHDSYVFELGDPDSGLYRTQPHITLCVLDPQVVFDRLPVPWTPDQVAQAFQAHLEVVAGLVRTFASANTGTLVLNTLPLPRRFTAQLIDHRSRATLGAIWREGNARLLRLAAEHPPVICLDLDPILSDGVAAYDPALSTYAKAHLAPGLLAAYAQEVGHLGRHLSGMTRKCLVLDLDNTVWGGVLGDDGPEGIEVRDSFRGEAFRAFQSVVKQLGSQGVLVAAVSKNDPEPVHAVLREHPGMTLRGEDFVRVVANWRPKHENLRELSTTLNLGVDSFVFVDDNPYECGLVRRELPGVTVVPVSEEPAGHVPALLRDGWFDVRELAVEDRGRPAQYRDELARADFLETFESIADYLRELGVRVRLASLTDADLARVSQLTLRTNQFNLTTERLQPAQVRARAADPAQRILTIRSADRFGDNGLVGVILTRRDGDRLHIDNFLLSCRVFARGIEQACLAAVLRAARHDGVRRVLGRYRPTAKNRTVRDLLPRYGFAEIGTDGDAVVFQHDLTDLPIHPEHIDLDDGQGGSNR
ncbi:HAD-IIIC family phosphatase [Micromonospora sp. NPDC005215]|uniref:HAD-IIIC family phosphatase n=1 Tax=Micromonospora sp. NPDC005215 TaxID=3157024 RepID=UPI0033A01268